MPRKLNCVAFGLTTRKLISNFGAMPSEGRGLNEVIFTDGVTNPGRIVEQPATRQTHKLNKIRNTPEVLRRLFVFIFILFTPIYPTRYLLSANYKAMRNDNLKTHIGRDEAGDSQERVA